MLQFSISVLLAFLAVWWIEPDTDGGILLLSTLVICASIVVVSIFRWLIRVCIRR